MSSQTKPDAATQAVTEPEKGLGLSRPNLLRAVADRAPGSRIEVVVTLRIGRSHYDGVSEGVGHETIELRTAAEAAMGALHEAIGHPHFELLGIKRLHAFDADVVLVALRDRDDVGRRYIGAVPVRSTLVHAAAAAVLDATNRIVTRSAD